MKVDFRCSCPFTSTLDVVGDKWTLVIIKQMLLEEKRTFKDFSESEEAIASNILSSRLKKMEEFKLITKSKLPENKKTNIYTLTEKGLALTPVLVELSIWGDNHLAEIHPNLNTNEVMAMLKINKEEMTKQAMDAYRLENGL